MLRKPLPFRGPPGPVCSTPPFALQICAAQLTGPIPAAIATKEALQEFKIEHNHVCVEPAFCCKHCKLPQPLTAWFASCCTCSTFVHVLPYHASCAMLLAAVLWPCASSVWRHAQPVACPLGLQPLHWDAACNMGVSMLLAECSAQLWLFAQDSVGCCS